jgi:hypothetical protein
MIRDFQALISRSRWRASASFFAASA